MYISHRVGRTRVAMPAWAWLLAGPLLLCGYIMVGIAYVLFVLPVKMITRRQPRRPAVPPWSATHPNPTPAMRVEDRHHGYADWTHTRWEARR